MSNETQRDAFWNTVYDLASADRNIIIVSADMGAPSMDRIRTNLAAQFVNTGIAEQNAIMVASGLAMKGKKAFVYAIAPFITLRCLEQIRVESGMMRIPITIVGVGAGLGYEDSGPTHHLIEDISVLRSIPGMRIDSITDDVMATSVARTSCSLKGSNYVRLDRKPYPRVYSRDAEFSDGLAYVEEGKDLCIATTGTMVHTALDIAKSLRRKRMNVCVLDVYTFPINGGLLLKRLKGVKKLVTVEEHVLPGGFGSAVCEVLSDAHVAIPTLRMGISTDRGYCYKYGGREALRGYYGLDRKNLETKISAFFAAR